MIKAIRLWFYAIMFRSAEIRRDVHAQAYWMHKAEEAAGW